MTPTDTNPRMPAWLEGAWLARYLDRQLDDGETAWFEAYLLDKPELVEMLEKDTALRDGLDSIGADWRSAAWASEGAMATPSNENASDVEYHEASSSPDPTFARRKPAARVSRGPAAWLAVAASLVLGVGLGWIGAQGRISAPPTEGLVANPTRIVFDTTRGEPSPPRREHDDASSPYLLVEVAVPANAQNIRLRTRNGDQRSLSPSPDGFVNFLIGRTRVAAEAPLEILYSIDGRQLRRELSRQQLEENIR